MAAPKWTPELWARTQPHTFYSRWPTATMTKCDWCGVYFRDHPAPVPDEVDVAKHPMKAIPYNLEEPLR